MLALPPRSAEDVAVGAGADHNHNHDMTNETTTTISDTIRRLLGDDALLGDYPEDAAYFRVQDNQSGPDVLDALDCVWGAGTADRFTAAGLAVEWSGDSDRDGRTGAYWLGVRVVRAGAPAPIPTAVPDPVPDPAPAPEPVADAVRRLLGDDAPKMENHGTYVYFGVEDSLDEEEEDVLDALDRVWGEGTASRFAAAGLVLEWSGDSDRDGSGVYWSGVYVEQALAPEEAVDREAK